LELKLHQNLKYFPHAHHVREGFFYSWNEKNRPVPLFVMLTVVAAIIPEGGLAPSLYRAKIEHEQLEMDKPMMRIEKTLLPLW